MPFVLQHINSRMRMSMRTELILHAWSIIGHLTFNEAQTMQPHTRNLTYINLSVSHCALPALLCCIADSV